MEIIKAGEVAKELVKGISNNSKKYQRTSQKVKRLDKERIARIHLKLLIAYGKKAEELLVKNKSKEDELLAFDFWSTELAGLSDEQIIYGLDNLPETFPPTAMEFKKICRQKPKRQGIHTLLISAPTETDEQKKQRLERGKAEMKKIKQKLERK